jgi:hypothetical protein
MPDSNPRDSDLRAAVESAKEAAARSINPYVTAIFIALSDPAVQELIRTKLAAEFVMNGVRCLSIVTLREEKYVYFDFDCKPNTHCFIKPAFVVVVNVIAGRVVSIIDPYVGPLTAGGHGIGAGGTEPTQGAPVTTYMVGEECAGAPSGLQLTTLVYGEEGLGGPGGHHLTTEIYGEESRTHHVGEHGPWTNPWLDDPAQPGSGPFGRF